MCAKLLIVIIVIIPLWMKASKTSFLSMRFFILQMSMIPRNGAIAKLENGLPIVATISGGAQAEWKEFEIRFEYKKEFDPNQKYRLSIAFTSSKDGDKFWGAPGSELIVDDIELVVE